MDVFEVIRSRRSIRKYSKRPVRDQNLLLVLEAARLAPSASNRQTWKFVVVRDREKKEKLAEASHNQGFLAEASVVIACCSTESDVTLPCGHPAFLIDVAIAIDHMTLAAVALDLGTCWIGAFNEDRVREILSIPNSVRIVELLVIGYPIENPWPRPRKQIEEIICYDTWY